MLVFLDEVVNCLPYLTFTERFFLSFHLFQYPLTLSYYSFFSEKMLTLCYFTQQHTTRHNSTLHSLLHGNCTLHYTTIRNTALRTLYITEHFSFPTLLNISFGFTRPHCLFSTYLHVASVMIKDTLNFYLISSVNILICTEC